MDDEHETASSDGMHPVETVGQPLSKKKMSYKKMIAEAIENLKERRGSSRQAILKFIQSKYSLGRGSSTRINSAITNMFKSKQLIRTRGSLKDGAFKLNSGHLTPFASAGRSRRGGRRGKSRGKRIKGKKGKKRRGKKAKKRRKRKGKKSKGRKLRKGRRGGRKRRVRRGKKKKISSRGHSSFYPTGI